MKARCIVLAALLMPGVLSVRLSGRQAAADVYTWQGDSGNWTDLNWLNSSGIGGFNGPTGGTDGAFIPSGAGTVNLSVLTNYTGDTTVNGGTLQIAGGGSLGGGPGVANYGGAINIGTGAMINNGYAAPVYLTGVVSGGGTLIQSGNDMILAPTSTNSINTLAVTAGRIFINSPQAIGTIGTVNVEAAGTLDFQAGDLAPTNAMQFASGTDLANRTGTLTLSTANATFPSTGAMIFNADDSSTSSIVITGNYPTLTGPMGFSVGGGGTPWGPVTLAGAVSGGSNLTMNGPGLMNLAGANTYTGDTIVNGGTLQIGGNLGAENGNNYSGAITIQGGAVLNNVSAAPQVLTGVISGGGTFLQSADDLVLAPPSNNTVSTLAVAGGRAFINSAQAIGTIGAVNVSGNGALVFQTVGDFAPANTITFASGTNLCQRFTGTLTLNTANATFPSSGLMIFNLDDQLTSNIVINGNYPALTGTMAFQVGGNNTPGPVTLAGAVSGTGSLAMNGPGLLILGGSNTYTGDTAVNGGTLQIGGNLGWISGQPSVYGGAITVGSGAVLINFGVVPQYLNGVLSGGGTLIQSGNDLILSPPSNNSISTVAITAGRVFISSAQAIGTIGTVKVYGGSTLDFQTGGDFAPTNSMTFAPGANLANRQGTLTLSTSNATFPGSGSMNFNMDDQPTSNIVINGSYPTLTGPITFQVGGGGGVPFGSVTLAGDISGNGSLTMVGPGTLILSGSNSYNGGTLVEGGLLIVDSPVGLKDGSSLTVGIDAQAIFGAATGGIQTAGSCALVPVPEPETLVLLVAGLIVGLGVSLSKIRKQCSVAVPRQA